MVSLVPIISSLTKPFPSRVHGNHPLTGDGIIRDGGLKDARDRALPEQLERIVSSFPTTGLTLEAITCRPLGR